MGQQETPADRLMAQQQSLRILDVAWRPTGSRLRILTWPDGQTAAVTKSDLAWKPTGGRLRILTWPDGQTAAVHVSMP